MSFPQTDDVIAGLEMAATKLNDAATLLRQYATLASTQEGTIEQFRADASETAALRKANAELVAKFDGAIKEAEREEKRERIRQLQAELGEEADPT